MIGIIVSGHGNFATGMVSALQLIVGECKNVASVDFKENDSIEDLTRNLEMTITKLKYCDELLFLTDLLGGSPFKCSVLAGQAVKECKVMAGANMPMLIEAAFANNIDKLSVIKDAVLEAGKNGVRFYDDEKKKKKENVSMGI